MVKLPVPTLAGLMPVRTGVAFKTVTVLVPDTVVDAELVARIVKEFGLGKVAGAVYFPDESTVPSVEDPPFVPFTDQVTAVLEVPVTLALNVYDSPARIFAVAGETDTLTLFCAGGGSAGGFIFETLPTQPKQNVAASTARNLGKMFMSFSHTLKEKSLGIV